jgi:hypothetical protein
LDLTFTPRISPKWDELKQKRWTGVGLVLGALLKRVGFCVTRICAEISAVTLWLFNIAMGNSPFIDGLPIKNGDSQWLC